MNQEKFQLSLQQDLLTLISHSDEHGKVVSKVVSPALFEGDYRVVAERALDFWRQYNTAPKQHIADLLSDILNNKHDRRAQTYSRILVQMIEVKDQINVEFVLQSMNQFIRLQRAKETILKVAENLDARGINGLAEAENELRGYLLEQNGTLDAGLRLNQFDKVLEFIGNLQSEFDTGVKELDEAHVIPMRGKMMLLIAPAKRGKTHFLVHLGKRAFLRRKKVLHITLEIEEEEVAQRYYQALFGASKRDDLNKIATFKFDKKGELDQIVSQSFEVPFTFTSPAIREELQTRIMHFGTRIDNIIIKRFPMSSLTLTQLEAYLETLSSIEKFDPDMVIIDYPKIMKLNANDLRISLGHLFENLRGLSQRRNFALAVVHQGNRESADAQFVKGTHVSEDWSIMGTCDFALTYSQTAAERKLGLARLFVEAGRSEADRFGVVITQSYKTGQFVLESTRLSESYARLTEQMAAHSGDDDVHDDARADK